METKHFMRFIDLWNSEKFWAMFLIVMSLTVEPFRAYGEETFWEWDFPIMVGSLALSFGLESNAEVKSIEKWGEFGMDHWAASKLDEELAYQSDVLFSAGMVMALGADAWILWGEDKALWFKHTLILSESLVLTMGITESSKFFFRRPRPYTREKYLEVQEGKAHWEADDTLSFFSGHTSMMAALTFSVASCISELNPEPWVWWSSHVLALASTGMIGYMRVASGKHYPSDVLMGGLVGFAVSQWVFEHHRPQGEAREKLKARGSVMMWVNKNELLGMWTTYW